MKLHPSRSGEKDLITHANRRLVGHLDLAELTVPKREGCLRSKSQTPGDVSSKFTEGRIPPRNAPHGMADPMVPERLV